MEQNFESKWRGPEAAGRRVWVMERVKLFGARCASTGVVILLVWPGGSSKKIGRVCPIASRRRTSSGLPGLPAKPIFRTCIYLANFLISLPCNPEPPETWDRSVLGCFSSRCPSAVLPLNLSPSSGPCDAADSNSKRTSYLLSKHSTYLNSVDSIFRSILEYFF